MTSTTAYIALGSNLGHREQHLDAAVDRLRWTQGVEVSRVSSILENPAVGGPEGSPPFLNAVAEIRTTLEAIPLLRQLLAIERELGRVRRERWGPRAIDLDLLLYGEQVINSPELILPHPLMHERRFVLQPLAEIAAAVVHPIMQVTIADLLLQLPP